MHCLSVTETSLRLTVFCALLPVVPSFHACLPLPPASSLTVASSGMIPMDSSRSQWTLSKDTSNCSSGLGYTDALSRPEFEVSVRYAVGNATKMAGSSISGGFGTAKDGGVYAMGQCWSSLSTRECMICLEKAGKEVRRCLPSKEGKALNAGCYFKYSSEKFYGEAKEHKS
ncbi:hypothetical protein SAY87_004034 [Trapa incisa]|uniref:Gnk2-homologous domain-containing protein n=2 Tax=Trapa TaxID=22665 RepID=A0AAN7R008_TRANT|nr:hypothetical protein SAY87_004034 [Trapa incisa]KAK4782480.1 hypothetical protein SAY86_016582 [Trapa natans]